MLTGQLAISIWGQAPPGDGGEAVAAMAIETADSAEGARSYETTAEGDMVETADA